MEHQNWKNFQGHSWDFLKMIQFEILPPIVLDNLFGLYFYIKLHAVHLFVNRDVGVPTVRSRKLWTRKTTLKHKLSVFVTCCYKANSYTLSY